MSGLGGRVRQARRARGWNTVDLAERAGVSDSYISRLENGKAGEKRGELERVATALEMPLGALFGEGARELGALLRQYRIDEETQRSMERIGASLATASPAVAEHARNTLRSLADLMDPPNGQPEGQP